MTQCIEGLAIIKPEDLSWVPRTHMVEGENVSTSCPLNFTSMVCTPYSLSLSLQTSTN